MGVLVDEEGLMVGGGGIPVVIKVDLGIKVDKYQSWFTRLTSIVLVLYSEVCLYIATSHRQYRRNFKALLVLTETMRWSLETDIYQEMRKGKRG